MTEKKLSFLQTLGSVLASFAGIQNNAKRERDFKQGRARDFIAVGVLITVLFVAGVYGVVKLVMSLSSCWKALVMWMKCILCCAKF